MIALTLFRRNLFYFIFQSFADLTSFRILQGVVYNDCHRLLVFYRIRFPPKKLTGVSEEKISHGHWTFSAKALTFKPDSHVIIIDFQGMIFGFSRHDHRIFTEWSSDSQDSQRMLARFLPDSCKKLTGFSSESYLIFTVISPDFRLILTGFLTDSLHMFSHVSKNRC